MAVTFLIPGPLREYTAGKNKVESDARPATVREALDALWALHPGVRDRVLTERDEVRQHVNVFVGKESIRFTGGLATPVPEGAEIWIVPAVSGG
jgi:molybdopterin converting factor small subunit